MLCIRMSELVAEMHAADAFLGFSGISLVLLCF